MVLFLIKMNYKNFTITYTTRNYSIELLPHRDSLHLQLYYFVTINFLPTSAPWFLVDDSYYTIPNPQNVLLNLMIHIHLTYLKLCIMYSMQKLVIDAPFHSVHSLFIFLRLSGNVYFNLRVRFNQVKFMWSSLGQGLSSEIVALHLVTCSIALRRSSLLKMIFERGWRPPSSFRPLFSWP